MTPTTAHHSNHGALGSLAELVTAVSMTAGRGRAARAVADLAQLRAGDRLVDVGCGPGTAVREAHRRGARAIGVDPSGPMLRLARGITVLRRADGVAFAEGTAEALPLSEDSATVVWALSSVHHWSNRAAGLAEARRVLAPGGRLLLAERLAPLGARGHATHGLTTDQAETISTELAVAGFTDIHTVTRRSGRRTLIIVAGISPS